MRSAIRCGLVLAVALGLSASARADSSEAPAVDNALTRGKRHFEQGMQAFEERDYRVAIREFEAALAQAPSAELWFDLARAHEELAEYDKALAAYERYLRDSVDASDAAAVRARVSELQRRQDEARAARTRSVDMGSLRIRSNVDDAVVTLDGRHVGRTPIDAPLALRPGSYRLDVVREGHLPLRAQVQVEQGMLTAAHANLTQASQARDASPRRTWTWVALGVTGALVTTSAALGVSSIARQRAGDDRDAARFMDGANIALGGAALCALATTILHFAEGSPHAEARVAPVLANHGVFR